MAKAKKGRPVGSRTTPTKTKKIDILIDTIFSVLPATTHEEILAKVTKRWKGKSLDLADIRTALRHLRRNAVRYGWTVPYVATGRPTGVDTGRYFIAEVNPDGSRKKCSPRNQEHLRRGAKRVLRTVSRFNNNEAIAIDLVRPTLPPALQRGVQSTARHMLKLSREEMQLLSQLEAVAA